MAIRSEKLKIEAATFDTARLYWAKCNDDLEGQVKQFVSDPRGWILFGPTDVRGACRTHRFALQCISGQKEPRVRAGCRYYTLKQAWKHWGEPRKGRGTRRKNECAQIVSIIRLMLLQVQAYGLMSIYRKPIKFDRTILKPKRKS